MSRERTRLTGTSYAFLSLLALRGPSTAYGLKQAHDRSVKYFWPASQRVFYVTLASLANAGLLSERVEHTGRRSRKVYELTEGGRLALQQWIRSPELAAPELRDEAVLKIYAGANPVAVLTDRAKWHRLRLAELERYLVVLVEGDSRQEDDSRCAGSRASLLVGIDYHRALLNAMECFLTSVRED